MHFSYAIWFCKRTQTDPGVRDIWKERQDLEQIPKLHLSNGNWFWRENADPLLYTVHFGISPNPNAISRFPVHLVWLAFVCKTRSRINVAFLDFSQILTLFPDFFAFICKTSSRIRGAFLAFSKILF